jgi:hypothetical protein
MPFLPGTAPNAFCSPGWASFGEFDSLYAADSVAFSAPDTGIQFEDEPLEPEDTYGPELPEPEDVEFDTTVVDTLPRSGGRFERDAPR